VLTLMVQRNHLLGWKLVHAEMDSHGQPAITG
jgi:hypothetical protein